jgi:hypothetical protein
MRNPVASFRLGMKNRIKYIKYVREFMIFRRLSAQSGNRFKLRWSDRRVCLLEKTAVTNFDRHYFYHPSWAARVLAETRPAMHIDISSQLSFSGVLSAFIPVEFYDYRPADLRLPNLVSKQADVCRLPFADNSILSMSCMHVIEHVGLGRYGDPLNPEADLTAMKELQRVLAPAGNLLFVVPVGQPVVFFNAHRVYSFRQIMQYFSGLELKQFALVPDAAGEFLMNATEQDADRQVYGCGCFWFRKPMA